MKRFASLVAITLLCLSSAPKAQAQTEILEQVANDLGAISVNTPIWLANHLPAMMGQSGMGAGIDLASDGVAGFSLGIIGLHLGLMNEFNEVGKGTELLGFEESMPANIPWPQFGVTAGLSLGSIELGADLRFIPETDVAMGEAMQTTVSVLSAAASLRWRLNQPIGPIPAVVIGVSGGIHRGTMKIGAGFKSAYAVQAEVPGVGSGAIEGHYEFSGSPIMEWKLVQVSPEIRLGWEFGPIRPFLGIALGLTYGKITGGAEVSATVTVEKVAGEAVSEEPRIHTESTQHFETAPALYTLRPHLGLDVVLGPFAFTAQVDLAIMTQDSVGTDVGGAAQSFVPADSDSLFSKASKESTTSAAVVTTLAARIQF